MKELIKIIHYAKSDRINLLLVHYFFIIIINLSLLRSVRLTQYKYNTTTIKSNKKCSNAWVCNTAVVVSKCCRLSNMLLVHV